MSTSEIFDADTVKGTIEGIGGEFSSLSSLIQSINGTVTTALGSPDMAMYGDAGNKVLATWDENCSTLNEFIKIFDNWSSMVVSIANEYSDLQYGTAKVEDEDKQYFQDIANANKSSWLKTEEAKEAYKGSISTYKDENGIEHTKTMNLKDGLVDSYTDENGNKTINYSTLAGTLIGSSINGKLTKNGKEVKELLTDEEEENKSKVEKAQTGLQENAKKRYEEALKNSDVYKASKEYADEYKNADEKYSSKNTFMTISNKNVNGANLRVTHIVVNDPSQIKTIQSNGGYGNGGESIYSMAKRTKNLVVAATGAFFKGDGEQNLIGNNTGVVADSKLVTSRSSTAGGNEICIDKNGKIFYAPAGVSWDTLINDYGVTNTYASHETQRLDNGQIINTGEWNKSYDRTYLCMKEPGEYYLIQGTTTPANAVTYAKDVLGCQFAGSLEQGGAVAEVTNEGVIQEHKGYDTISNAFAIVDV